MQKIMHVVGARPNFMKIAPIMSEMAKHPNQFEQTLVHTGQHYDENMSQVFFDELELPRPDINLEVGSATHAQQTALIMVRFEPVLLEHSPDWLIVPGDVNSTLACALVATKLGVKVAHVEAGLRSFDRTMPEEINRVLTDQISDILFTPSQDADENLLREGVAPERIHFVGNVMIDTLVRLLPKAEKRWPGLQQQLELDRYVLVTLHRPSNVDDRHSLTNILAALEEIGVRVPVVFPIHPRTHRRINHSNLKVNPKRIVLIDPVSYIDFLALQMNATVVLTDSGGVQEETTYLGIPCLTVRPNTERPITITQGTNCLVSNNQTIIAQATRKILDADHSNTFHPATVPTLWDGNTAVRIMNVLGA